MDQKHKAQLFTFNRSVILLQLTCTSMSKNIAFSFSYFKVHYFHRKRSFKSMFLFYKASINKKSMAWSNTIHIFFIKSIYSMIIYNFTVKLPNNCRINNKNTQISYRSVSFPSHLLNNKWWIRAMASSSTEVFNSAIHYS